MGHTTSETINGVFKMETSNRNYTHNDMKKFKNVCEWRISFGDGKNHENTILGSVTCLQNNADQNSKAREDYDAWWLNSITENDKRMTSEAH
jgi:hypothetical protein